MIISVITFFIVLSILVLVHELGHFIAARKAGVWVEEFGFGLPPRLFGKKIGETLYSFNALPFGGFVKLHGENSGEGVTDPTRAFLNKGKLPRVVIIVAGVFMNFVLAVMAFALVYSFTGLPRPTEDVKVVDVSPESPAQVGGLLVGDIVNKVDKVEVKSNKEFIDLIEARKGERVVLEVIREQDGQSSTSNVTLTPRADHPETEGPLGVTITDAEVYYPPVWQRPFIGIYYGFKDALFWGRAVLGGLGRIFTDLLSGSVPNDLAGPVGIYAVTTQASQEGILTLINLIGILSVNLAILNIMPFPALDGGRLLFIGVEAVLGRKVLPKFESIVHTVGMIILLFVIFAITAHDIQRLIQAGSISGFIDSVLK